MTSPANPPTSDDGDFFARFARTNQHRPLRFIAALRGSPKIGAAFEAFAQTVLSECMLAPALRELIILRVALACNAPYIYGGHLLMSEDVGLELPGAEGRWQPDQALALSVTDQLLAGHLDPDLRPRAVKTFGRQGLLELAFVVGQYRLVATVIAALGIDPEPGTPEMPAACPWPPHDQPFGGEEP